MTGTSERAGDPLLAAVMAGIEVIDLAQPLTTGMPCSPNHPGFRMMLARRHGDMVRSDGGSSANEVIITGGHVGTHVDALAHVSQDGVLHGGVGPDRGSVHGPRRGRHPAEGVSRRVVGRREGARRRVPSRRLRHHRRGYGCGGEAGCGAPVPGVTPAAAQWLVQQEIIAAGADTSAFEQVHPGRGHATLPVHRILLVDHSTHIIEHLRLGELAARNITEFTFVLAPLNIVGATGSPLRPLALVSGNR
ncbi:MAG: cyclase family protein [Pseudonocardiaceae bacterium]